MHLVEFFNVNSDFNFLSREIEGNYVGSYSRTCHSLEWNHA